MCFLIAACALTVACLLSGGHAAPLTCDDLVRPLDQLDPRRLEGTWALVAGSLSYLPYLERFKSRDSAAIHFPSNTSETSMSYTRTLRLNDTCQYDSMNISLEGSSFTYDGTSNLRASFVHTSCRDCVLMLMNVESGKRLHFYLFSRRRQLEEEEMEEFRTQVECLKLPTPAAMDPTKELCPEEKDSGSAAKTEEKPQENNN